MVHAKVGMEIYGCTPYTPHPVVRARCDVDGVEHGYEWEIAPGDPWTVGQAIDLALARLSGLFAKPSPGKTEIP